MEVKFVRKKAFSLIGKLGSTNDVDFIQKTWNDFNSDFQKILKYAKKDANGIILGLWGAMSSVDNKFNAWEENYTKGLYLAAVEVEDDVVAPLNWTRWKVPEFNYAYVKVENNYAEVFRYILSEFLPSKNLSLAGAVQEYYDILENMQLYLFFPVK